MRRRKGGEETEEKEEVITGEEVGGEEEEGEVDEEEGEKDLVAQAEGVLQAQHRLGQVQGLGGVGERLPILARVESVRVVGAPGQAADAWIH